MTPPVGRKVRGGGGGGMSSPGQGVGESTHWRNDSTCTGEGEEGGER